MEKHYEFNEAPILSAVAMGVPGKRTFFLIIGEEQDWVRVWLEKEHLEALGLAIEQFITNLPEEHLNFPRNAEQIILPDGFSSRLPSAELEIEQISLGYDEDKVVISFIIHVVGPHKIDQAGLECRVTLSQLEQLGDEAKNICAAGRSRCKLCGRPIDPEGHICPKDN